MSFFGGGNKVFGLDIGFELIKLCELSRHGNRVHVVGLSEIPITERILDKDRIKNKAATANLIKEARRKSKPHSISATKIVTALPETFVFSKTIRIPKMSQTELQTAAPAEAAQYLPIPIADVYIDYQILLAHPDEPLMDILIAAAPKRLVDDYVDMAKMADLELAALETKPIAVGRALISDKSTEGIVVLHIGTELSRISIWDKGKIRLVTTTAVGKNQIIEFFQSTNTAYSDISKIDLSETDNIDVGPLQLAIDALNEAIRYHQNRGYKPSKIVRIEICGSAAKVKNIDRYIEKETKIPSRIAQPRFHLDQKISPDDMTAFGLALRES